MSYYDKNRPYYVHFEREESVDLAGHKVTVNSSGKVEKLSHEQLAKVIAALDEQGFKVSSVNKEHSDY